MPAGNPLFPFSRTRLTGGARRIRTFGLSHQRETGSFVATWGARIVLVDDNGVRATMTASWLKQMGWDEVAVLTAGPADGDWVSGPYRPRVLRLEGLATATIEPRAVCERLAGDGAVVIDLDTSRRYAQGHIPGAWFAMRSSLAEVRAKLPKAETIVLTSPDDRLARLAAAEIAPAASLPVMVLAGGTEAWRHAGLPVETGASHR
jgi:rhodanese-related sulfurtransferase